jgi:hypothetical protein
LSLSLPLCLAKNGATLQREFFSKSIHLINESPAPPELGLIQVMMFNCNFFSLFASTWFLVYFFFILNVIKEMGFGYSQI